jgi:NAD(P)-dependent dehydrogenase (short-subunit alcohol dehydrogenase family)
MESIMTITATRSVVVTGASTGIGCTTVKDLHQRGFQVFASVRKPEDGEALQKDISPNIVPLLFDVTEADAIATAARKVSEEVGEKGLYGLVNNAGIAVTAPVEFLALDDLRRQIEINVIGQVAVTKAFLGLLRRARGRIVFTGSISGKVSLPLVSPYAISKHALEALSDSLRVELSASGISVSLVEPGVIFTPLWEKSLKASDDYLAGLPKEAHDLYGPMMRSMRAQSAKMAEAGIPAEKVARAIAHALTARRPKTRYLVGKDAKIGAFARKWLPDRLFDRIIRLQLGL